MEFDKSDKVNMGELYRSVLDSREPETLDCGDADPVTLKNMLDLLASRIPEHVLPMGLFNAIELACYDFSTGSDGFSGEDLPDNLRGIDSQTINEFRMQAITDIAMLFGKEVGEEIIKMYEQIPKFTQE